jgi:hypothetical protein
MVVSRADNGDTGVESQPRDAEALEPETVDSLTVTEVLSGASPVALSEPIAMPAQAVQRPAFRFAPIVFALGLILSAAVISFIERRLRRR